MLEFLRQTWRDYHHVGAIAPSSRSLARAIAKALDQRPTEGPMRVLEVGPGTGALTRGILEKLSPGDFLVLCEINRDFADHLDARFTRDPEFARWRNSVEIVCKPVEEFGARESFHHIVCGLPFNNFAPDVVRGIFQKFADLLVPGGTVNFFEYAWIRPLKRLVSNAEQRRHTHAVEEILGDLIRRHQIDQQLVLWNLPPAWARTLQFRPPAD
jgi:phospholipid N-methyltransferase